MKDIDGVECFENVAQLGKRKKCVVELFNVNAHKREELPILYSNYCKQAEAFLDAYRRLTDSDAADVMIWEREKFLTKAVFALRQARNVDWWYRHREVKMGKTMRESTR